MAGKYIISLDQGTTSSRTIIFDKNQNIISKFQQEYPQIYPKPGWVEHNPQDIYNSQYSTTIDALIQAEKMCIRDRYMLQGTSRKDHGRYRKQIFCQHNSGGQTRYSCRRCQHILRKQCEHRPDGSKDKTPRFSGSCIYYRQRKGTTVYESHQRAFGNALRKRDILYHSCA